MHVTLVNGEQGAGLPGDDPGFTRGLNVFETLRTYGRAPFRLEQHLDRLAGSASSMAIPMPDRELVRAEVLKLCALHDNLSVRIALTAGGNRVTSVQPIDATRINRPMRVATVRMQPLSFLPGTVKHGSRAAWVMAAQRLAVDEVMFVDDHGRVLECNRSNVFAVVGGSLWTPNLDGGLLAGVTRSALLEAAREAGLDVRVASLPADAPWTELYATSTLKEIAPIVAVDGTPLAAWGPVGRALQAEFRVLVQRECGM